MALNIDILAAGTITSTASTNAILAAVAGQGILIKSMVFVNNSATLASRLRVKLRPAGTNARFISPVPVSIPPSGTYRFECDMTLSGVTGALDDLVAYKQHSTDDADLGFVIFGVTRNQ